MSQSTSPDAPDVPDGKNTARTTFREKQNAVCHQRIVRERAAESADIAALFPQPDPVPPLKRARVRQVTRAIAWKVISRYEWLGTLPACNRFFGIFFDDFCAGVACYSVGSVGAGGFAVSRMLGVPQSEIAYLARGACVHWAPTGSAPKLINFSARATDRLVALAYSDTDAGEIGTVYQAAGWVCLGKGQPVEEWVSPAGRIFNQMLIRDLMHTHGGSQREWKKKLLLNGWRVQPSNPKLRYGLILPRGKGNVGLESKFAEMAVPYPKRDLARLPVEGLQVPPGERRFNSDPDAPPSPATVTL